MLPLFRLDQWLTVLCFPLKCDERKPSCEKCVARNTVCTYPPSAPLIWKDKRQNNSKLFAEELPIIEISPAYSSSPQDEASLAADIDSSTTLNLENIDLIIHWFTKTVYTVNPPSKPAAIEICQTVILHQAMKHHFLLHGLLAMSALHLADYKPESQKYTRVAIAHHTKGLSQFQSILDNIDESNFSAIIAFSSLTIMFQFGLSRCPTYNSGMEILNALEQTFILCKGWQKIVRIADGLDCRAGTQSIRSSSKPYTSRLPQEIEAKFGQLHSLNHDQNVAVYALTISSLRSVFEMLADKGTADPHAVVEWVHTIPEDFIFLIREREKMALLIVAYYCIVLDSVPQVWWIRGRARPLLEVIGREIKDPAYRGLLEWPRRIVGTGS